MLPTRVNPAKEKKKKTIWTPRVLNSKEEYFMDGHQLGYPHYGSWKVSIVSILQKHGGISPL
jgi:hypothetical protein